MFGNAVCTIALNLSILAFIGSQISLIAVNESLEATENRFWVRDIGIHSDAQFIHNGLNRVEWRTNHKHRLVMAKIFEELRWLVINMIGADHHKLCICILCEPVGMGVADGL
jgi:hypothetical protein